MIMIPSVFASRRSQITLASLQTDLACCSWQGRHDAACNSSSGSCQLREIYPRSMLSLQTRAQRLGTRVTRTLCGATSRGRAWAWGAATSATPTTTSPPSTSPSTPPAPTTSSVSHHGDILMCIKENVTVYSNLHVVWHKMSLWCYWHHCPPDCRRATFGHTVRLDITDCGDQCFVLQLFIQLGFNWIIYIFVIFRV